VELDGGGCTRHNAGMLQHREWLVVLTHGRPGAGWQGWLDGFIDGSVTVKVTSLLLIAQSVTCDAVDKACRHPLIALHCGADLILSRR
jgi:hypothetical protein